MGVGSVGSSVGCFREVEIASTHFCGSKTLIISYVSSLDGKPPLKEHDSILHGGKCTSLQGQNSPCSPGIAFLEPLVWLIGYL